MRHHWLTLLTVLSTLSLADLVTHPAPLWSDMHVKHMWISVPPNWESLGPPPTNTTIDLYIALKPHHENALIDALYEVSNPGHKNYGAHLSKEQVAELVAPHNHTLELVHSWLEHHGVPSSFISTSHGGGWLKITSVPVSQADRLLCASYQLYRHTGTNGTVLRTVSYGLPAALHPHVKDVVPTTYFGSPRKPPHRPRKRSGEAAVMMNVTSRADDHGDVTPSMVRSMYKTETYVPAAEDEENGLGILGFGKEYPSEIDLTVFMANYRTDAIDAVYSVEEVNGGGYDPDNPGQEANLDTQWAAAMAYPIPQIFFSTGGNLQWTANGMPKSGDEYIEWFKYILDLPDIPSTISISFGDPELTYPKPYALSLCNLFARLGALGVSVLFGSGDEGVGREQCPDSDSDGSDDSNDSKENDEFMPVFPASCPFVTSVGGTLSHDPEKAMPLSGGGFSYYFEREYYQETAVDTFLAALGDQYAGLYNPEGRGIPDIAAQSDQLVIVYKDAPYVVTGTSGSTPIVAGIVALLNDYLLSIGRDPLGFLNPWLYGRGRGGLNDIISGSNPGCGTEGFTAIIGWDPVTGLGTPNFVELLRLLPDT